MSDIYQRMRIVLDLPLDLAQKLHWLREAYEEKFNQDRMKKHLAEGKLEKDFSPIHVTPSLIVQSAVIALLKSCDDSAEKLGST
jgi:hypothetical protein